MDHFEKLRLLLDAHPTGAPKSEVFDEILRILFSPEEAIVVCAFHYPVSFPIRSGKSMNICRI
ncbi:MAG: hypothetical protein KKI04_05345 [Proteobacteria bacterium]|nr:hypothetical protein [Pseudomonadota bacterium]